MRLRYSSRMLKYMHIDLVYRGFSDWCNDNYSMCKYAISALAARCGLSLVDIVPKRGARELYSGCDYPYKSWTVLNQYTQSHAPLNLRNHS